MSVPRPHPKNTSQPWRRFFVHCVRISLSLPLVALRQSLGCQDPGIHGKCLEAAPFSLAALKIFSRSAGAPQRLYMLFVLALVTVGLQKSVSLSISLFLFPSPSSPERL